MKVDIDTPEFDKAMRAFWGPMAVAVPNYHSPHRTAELREKLRVAAAIEAYLNVTKENQQ